MPRLSPAAGVCAAGVAAAALLSGCASSTGSAAPTWVPKPSFQGENIAPGGPQPQLPASSTPAQPQPSHSPSSGGSKPATHRDPAVVATRLSAPTGIAIMPDGSALVGERTTGRIVRVQPVAGKPVPTVRTLTDIDSSGGGGLLDLALSPNYSQDKLIFAYITTPTDNRVVDFTLHGPVTPVLTGIPRGTSDNVGRIAFDADGNLLVGTGDAGHPALAASKTSFAGKVLRLTDIGTAAPGNPKAGSKIYASGLRRSDGLCVQSASTVVFQTEARGGTSSDPVNVLVPGAAYGWPRGSRADRQPVALMPYTSRSPGGCAVLNGKLYVTSLDGDALLSATIRIGTGGVALGPFTPLLRNKYGRLRTVVAAPDGSLWLTTSNRDGRGHPIPTDERVLHITPSGASATDRT